MRDIVLEETIYMDFTTRAITGVPTVLAGTPALSVLEENNATPITSGVSVSVDRASVVGLNMATIVATAANGYENGKSYSVYISTGTVNSVSAVGEIVGQFTIGASSATQDLANATDGLGALKALIDTLTTNVATVDTEVGVIDGIVDNILVDTAEIGAAGAGLTALATAAALATVDTEVGVIDGIVDAILLDTAEIGAAGAGLTALATAAALATVDTEVGVIDGVVDAILLDTAEIGAAGAGLTALATAAALATVDTEVGTIDTVVDAIKAVTDVLPDSGALTTIDGNVDAIKVITDALTSAAATKLAASMLGVVTGTASSGDTDTVVTDITGHGNDTFNGRLMVMTSGTLRYEAGIITDYVSATGTFEFAASTFTTSPTTETCIIL